MRPGRLNPGKPKQCVGSDVRSARFNEAGAIKPRKVFPSHLHLDHDPCFNEAGAIKPRKGLLLSSTHYRWEGFNEAGAIKPRKVPD